MIREVQSHSQHKSDFFDLYYIIKSLNHDDKGKFSHTFSINLTILFSYFIYNPDDKGKLWTSSFQTLTTLTNIFSADSHL